MDILPFDSARIILNEGGADECYINASSIQQLLPGAPAFVAAQGPKPNTVEHFWKMIFQVHCQQVVMLTRVKEVNRVKCEEYWQV